MNKERHLDKVNHDYIRYANVWEDPYILTESLQATQGDKILSIASAGDNSFALLKNNPEIVLAVDLNYPQLFLTELKKCAIASLEREEVIAFLGFTESDQRVKLYHSIRSSLSTEAANYWDQYEDTISSGIMISGKFEKYLKLFATKLLPVIHSKKKINQLFESKSALEQEAFYNKKWDTFLWRLFFRIFFSKRLMGLLGRDPAFLKQVKVNVAETIRLKAGEHIASTFAQDNPILFYCLHGHFGPYLPLYLKEDNFMDIKDNINGLTIAYGYAQEAAKDYGLFDKFNLSNIFEYMDEQSFKSTTDALVSIGRPEAKYAYWNLLVKRNMSAISNELKDLSVDETLRTKDQGFFYRQFVVNHKIKG